MGTHAVCNSNSIATSNATIDESHDAVSVVSNGMGSEGDHGIIKTVSTNKKRPCPTKASKVKESDNGMEDDVCNDKHHSLSKSKVDLDLQNAMFEYSIAAGYSTSTSKRSESITVTTNDGDAGDNSKHHRNEDFDEMVVDKSVLTSSIPPKRPLSAYNLFFHLERQRILQEQLEVEQQNAAKSGNDDATATPLIRRPHVDYTMADVVEFAKEQIRQMVSEYSDGGHGIEGEDGAIDTADQRKCSLSKKPKRKHRKTHGKISFTELARTVAARWKEMSRKQKCIFHGYFAVELSRHKKQYEMWLRHNVKNNTSHSKITKNCSDATTNKTGTSTSTCSNSDTTSVSDQECVSRKKVQRTSISLTASTKSVSFNGKANRSDAEERCKAAVNTMTNNIDDCVTTINDSGHAFGADTVLPDSSDSSMTSLLNRFNYRPAITTDNFIMRQMYQNHQDIRSQQMMVPPATQLSSLLALQQQQLQQRLYMQQQMQSRRVSLDNGTFYIPILQQAQSAMLMGQQYPSGDMNTGMVLNMMNNNDLFCNQQFSNDSQYQYPMRQTHSMNQFSPSSQNCMMNQFQQSNTVAINSAAASCVPSSSFAEDYNHQQLQHQNHLVTPMSTKNTISVNPILTATTTSPQFPLLIRQKDDNVESQNNFHNFSDCTSTFPTASEEKLQQSKNMNEIVTDSAVIKFPHSQEKELQSVCNANTALSGMNSVNVGDYEDNSSVFNEDDADDVSVLSSSSSVRAATSTFEATKTPTTVVPNHPNYTSTMHSMIPTVELDSGTTTIDDRSFSYQDDCLNQKIEAPIRVFAMPDALSRADDTFEKVCASLLSQNERAIQMNEFKTKSKNRKCSVSKTMKSSQNRLETNNKHLNNIKTIKKTTKVPADSIATANADDQLRELQRIMLEQQKKLKSQQERMDQMMRMMKTRLSKGSKKKKHTVETFGSSNHDEQFSSTASVASKGYRKYNSNQDITDLDAFSFNECESDSETILDYCMRNDGDVGTDHRGTQFDDEDDGCSGGSYYDECDDDFCPSSMMFDTGVVD